MDFGCLVWKCCYVFCCGLILFGSAIVAGDVPSANLRSNFSSASTERTSAESRKPHLRLTSGLKDVSLISGDRVQLKCKIDAWPNNNLKFTWYKDTKVVTAVEEELTIRNRPTGTRLTIRNLLTSDGGTYRCEISNGELSVHSTAHLQVSFSKPPDDYDYETKIPSGKCEEYKGKACQSLLSGQQIYVDPFLTQERMEEQITLALSHLNKKTISESCRHYAYPAFCIFVFSPCELDLNSESGEREAFPVKLCREDCELMKYDVCVKEYFRSESDSFTQKLFDTANCSTLPATTPNSKCSKSGLPSVVDDSHKCYNATGMEYRGTVSLTKTGRTCNPWPSMMIHQHKELIGGHNYCRNPSGTMEMPWCYISDGIKAECNLEKCNSASSGPNIILIVVPCAVLVIVICCIATILVCRRRNQKNNSADKTIDTKSNQSVAYSNKTKLPELSPNVLHILTSIGNCHYGKVFKAQLLPNPHVTSKYPVVVKTLRDGYTTRELEDFQKELHVFSELQHLNVACLKAFVLQSTMHALIFEHTDGVDLHEYLVMHSPQSDVEMGSKTNPNSSMIEEKEFIRIALQIANGMDYLSSKSYVHRDLAARNVLVCGNLEIKISNLGVVRDSYLSSYYRSPQGGQMLPIRWMAPESLHSWKFSDKSSIWSFGVLLWEMFSYGLQPYCGYSNHEVLEMISRRQLLVCPDLCSAKIYSLMQECWVAHPDHRPNFKDLRAKLQGWDTSGSERVTSQLAQGIHGQLGNIMRDGYGQYHPAHSVSGSSGTFNSGNNSLPPPHYLNSGAYPTAPLMMGPQRSSGGPVVPEMGYQQYPGSYGPAEQQYPSSTARIIQLPKRENSYSKSPGSHCSKASSSCSSSAADKYSSPKQSLLKSITETHNDTFRHSDGKPEMKEEQHYQEPKLIVRTNVTGKETKHTNPENNRFLERDSSDRSSNSFKATSCDSGLPVDDLDNHPNDCAAPLIGRSPLRVQTKPSTLGSAPKQLA